MKKAIIHQHYPLDYAREEALNSICTNLAFIGTDKRKIVITSNSQSEGKSWMTMHIAENMARRGRHVVKVVETAVRAAPVPPALEPDPGVAAGRSARERLARAFHRGGCSLRIDRHA